MKKLLLTILTLTTFGAMAQLPSGSQFEFEFTGGSLANTSTSGANSLSGSTITISDRFGNANNAIDPTGVISGSATGTPNVLESTLCFWMKSSSPTSLERILQMYGSGGNGFRVEHDQANHLFVNVQIDNNTSSPTGGFSRIDNVILDDNNWHHIAVRTSTYGANGIEIEVFVDNVLQPIAVNPTFALTNPITEFINNANFVLSPTNNYSGNLDEIFFYKTALTDIEIGQIYNYPTAITPSCTVTIPDANFKTYLVGNSAINTNGDTEIQCSEASAYTGSVLCNNLNISDLTGIEAFYNINFLNCSNNNSLTSLDVSTNTVLTALNCRNTNIINLDINGNEDLIELYCYNNSSLTTLNAGNGNNTNFLYFLASNTPNLSCITVDDVNWSNSNWTVANNSIDVGASFSTNCAVCSVNIPDANFKTYLVGNSAINTNGDTEIQCSEASTFTGTIFASSLMIQDLTGIEAFTSLQHLKCDNNQLTSLDLSSNTALFNLQSHNNSITSVTLGNNSTLDAIGLNGNNLSTIDISGVPNISGLYVSDNNLSTIDFSYNSIIFEIACQNNSISTFDFSQNQSLAKLYCSGNTITNLDLSGHSNIIKLLCTDMISLTQLNIANTNNSNVTEFDATNNPNLSCIEVDNVTYSTSNWTDIDATTSFSTNCLSVGISETTKQLTIKSFPNPTIGKVAFETIEIIKIIEIYNLAGQKLVTLKNSNTIDISSLPKGIYTAKIITESSNFVIQKLIKE